MGRARKAGEQAHLGEKGTKHSSLRADGQGGLCADDQKLWQARTKPGNEQSSVEVDCTFQGFLETKMSDTDLQKKVRLLFQSLC